eukprot:SAG22_NODE_4001_length_1429_cov_1.694737_2_plen_54_part_00
MPCVSTRFMLSKAAPFLAVCLAQVLFGLCLLLPGLALTNAAPGLTGVAMIVQG